MWRWIRHIGTVTSWRRSARYQASAWGELVSTSVPSMSRIAAEAISLSYPPALRLLRDAGPARDHVDEVFEMLGRPTLEHGGAVRLVRGHHRVAVVPVELRLGVEPEGAAGAVGDLGERRGVWLAAVGARVAEHDHRGARVEVLGDLGAELEPHAAVVGVTGYVGDAALAADLL